VDSTPLYLSDTSLRYPVGSPEDLAEAVRLGVVVEATDLARGPWDPGALHGGPVSAALAFAVETQDVASSFVVARLTVELERVVPPHRPLQLSAEIVRPGRKVQLVEAALRLEGNIVARARAMCIRAEHLDLPDEPLLRPDAPPSAEGVRQTPTMTDTYAAFHNAANEHRFVEGSWIDRGPVFVWVHLNVPLFAGRSLSPLQRVAAAADFGNGVSATLPNDSFTFINPDLTIHQNRPLAGEWVGMRARSHVSDNGVGFAESELFDRGGRIGRSLQSLLLDRRR
jgi:acyl-coenzyme A thioesterase PaaI-like protein